MCLISAIDFYNKNQLSLTSHVLERLWEGGKTHLFSLSLITVNNFLLIAEDESFYITSSFPH